MIVTSHRHYNNKKVASSNGINNIFWSSSIFQHIAELSNFDLMSSLLGY